MEDKIKEFNDRAYKLVAQKTACSETTVALAEFHKLFKEVVKALETEMNTSHMPTA